jgi:hypothetical protein
MKRTPTIIGFSVLLAIVAVFAVAYIKPTASGKATLAFRTGIVNGDTLRNNATATDSIVTLDAFNLARNERLVGVIVTVDSAVLGQDSTITVTVFANDSAASTFGTATFADSSITAFEFNGAAGTVYKPARWTATNNSVRIRFTLNKPSRRWDNVTAGRFTVTFILETRP